MYWPIIVADALANAEIVVVGSTNAVAPVAVVAIGAVVVAPVVVVASTKICVKKIGQNMFEASDIHSTISAWCIKLLMKYVKRIRWSFFYYRLN